MCSTQSHHGQNNLYGSTLPRGVQPDTLFRRRSDGRALNAGVCRTQDTKDWTQPAWPEPIGTAPCCKGLTAALRMQTHQSSPSAVGLTGWTAALVSPVYPPVMLPPRAFYTSESALLPHTSGSLVVARGDVFKTSCTSLVAFVVYAACCHLVSSCTSMPASLDVVEHSQRLLLWPDS